MRWWVDLGRALTGLRHLRGSPEPGRVFSELAAVCVPAICDEVLADHASAVVHRERTTRGLTDPATARRVATAMGDAQRVAAATGVLMALHHLARRRPGTS